MIVEILATGNEVVEGDIVNSNAGWLAQRMRERGGEVRFHSAVPDDEALIADGLRRAVGRADLVLVTGGLGPTVDDLTLEVAGRTFGRPLQVDEPSLERIRGFFAALGRTLTPNQEKQAWLPQGSTPLINDLGTAPGAFWREGKSALAFFPGVPKEMQRMFEKRFLPLIESELGKEVRLRKVLRCFGLPEGQMDQMLRPLQNAEREIEGAVVGFRVRFPTIDVRLQVAELDAGLARQRLEAATQKVKAALGPVVFGEDDFSLEEAVVQLFNDRKLKLATAESCTGGLVANLITDVPGASLCFLEGAVTYSDEAKMARLGVFKKTLDAHGAVSSEVALEMARGIRRTSGADFGIGITGIAGPSGGSETKPVGTVHIAVAHPEGQWEQKFFFPFDRLRFKQITAAAALDRVRRILLGL
ncbi:MAG TPA: competence/damage-inducible protein A [bacterium]|nr:competence/damage-inducible protein A [bacterium]